MLYRLRNGLKRRMDRARLPTIARQVMDDGLTYLSRERMLSLVSEVSRVNRLGVAGNLAEFGIALGGSSIVLAHKRQNRSFAGYDVFGMIPAPGSSDSEDAHSRYQTIKNGQSSGIGGKQYYGYQHDLYSAVVASFESHGLHVDQSAISLHKGLFQETFRPQPSDQLALVHIDCDWYDPVHYCLTHVSPILSSGGTIIVDDFNDYEGCHNAVQQVLAEDRTLSLQRSQPHAVIRKSSSSDRLAVTANDPANPWRLTFRARVFILFDHPAIRRFPDRRIARNCRVCGTRPGPLPAPWHYLRRTRRVGNALRRTKS